MFKRAGQVVLISVLVGLSPHVQAKHYLSDIQNGRAFRDLNGNGLADDQELAAWSDEQGNLDLAAGRGRLYLDQGIDRLTGRTNRYLLTVPRSAGSIGVLSTLWQSLLDRHHSNRRIAYELNIPNNATSSQFKALPIQRLKPKGVPLMLLRRNVQLQNLLRVLDAMIGGSMAAVGGFPVEDRRVGIMADALSGVMPPLKRDWKPLDLADVETVRRILARVLTDLSLVLPAETDLALIAQTLAELNGFVSQAGPATPDVLKNTALRGIGAARLVAEGRYRELATAATRSVPLILGIDPDTGKRDTDGVTNDEFPSITGVANEAAIGVRVALDNGMTGYADLGSGGQWTWRPHGRLVEGSYLCTAVGIGAGGSESEPSNAMPLVVDTTPPEVATVDVLTTLDATPVLSGTWNPAGNTLAVTVNHRTYSGSSITTNGATWSLPLPAESALPSGRYDVATRVTDLAANAANHTATGALLIEHEFSHLFGAPSFIDAGLHPFLAKLADFDNDGKLDLAVTGDNPLVSVFPGNGDGTFRAAIETLGISPWPL